MTTTQFVVNVGEALTVGLLTWIATSVRRAVKQFRLEHHWLMKTTDENTVAIKRILENEERRYASERRSRGR